MTVRSLVGRLRAKLALPLFLRELTEASARPRTYVVRTLYAGALFLLAIFFAWDVLFPSGDAFAVLGRGAKLYAIVMAIQFGGVYLFLPALTAASITAEKERNTLGLLLLTKLSPTKIVLEKFLARVFPMVCLAFLALPLLGVAYTLGGLESQLIFDGTVRLIATILMIGAIGIACSAWCRTTAGAFLSTYALLGILFPGPLLLAMSFGLNPGDSVIRLFGRIAQDARLLPIDEPEAIVGLFFGPLPVLIWLEGLDRPGGGTGFLIRSPWLVLWQTTPLLLVAAISLGVARWSLVRRAEVKPKHYMARVFQSLDSRFRALNDRYGRGIEIIKSGGSLPDDAPVAWRETTKTTLGSFRYLVRILLLVEVPILFLGVLTAGTVDSYSTGALGMIAFLLWLGGVLLVTVKAAGLFAGERARQSLDVLLTTPMATRAIVAEKLSGVWRLIAIVAVPMMTTWVLLAFMRYLAVSAVYDDGVLYVALGASVTLTHLAVPAYLALLIGLKFPTQSRAVLTAVAVLTGMCLAAPLLHAVRDAGGMSHISPDEWTTIALQSPATVVFELLDSHVSKGDLWYLLIGNTLLYGGLAVALRWACYRNAPRWLGRDENDSYIVPSEPVEQMNGRLIEEHRPEPAEMTG